MAAGEIGSQGWRQDYPGVTRFSGRQVSEQVQLLAIGHSAALDGGGAENAEAEVGMTCGGRPIGAHRFEGSPLQSREGATQLLVGATVGAAAHGAQERVQGKGNGPVWWRPGLVVSMEHLDVDVLVERAGEAIAGGGYDAPASAVVGRERHGRVVRRITETEDREFLEGAIEENSANDGSTTRSESHQGWKLTAWPASRQ